MAKKKRPTVLDENELNKKSTKELLGYLRRLQNCEASFEHSDMDVNEDELDDQTIYFKQTEKWNLAYARVKSILSSREHIQTRRSQQR